MLRKSRPTEQIAETDRVTYELQSQSMAIDARYLSHILVYGCHSDYGGNAVMELDELMRLRLYAKSNANRVISKDVFLSVLDSHIRLSISLDDRLSIREKKTPPRANMSVTERVTFPTDNQAHAAKVREIYEKVMNL